MKVYEIKDSSGIDGLRISERREPAPGYGQALVKVKATSLNYRDLATVKGAAARAIKLPLVPLSDGRRRNRKGRRGCYAGQAG